MLRLRGRFFSYVLGLLSYVLGLRLLLYVTEHAPHGAFGFGVRGFGTRLRAAGGQPGPQRLRVDPGADQDELGEPLFAPRPRLGYEAQEPADRVQRVPVVPVPRAEVREPLDPVEAFGPGVEERDEAARVQRTSEVKSTLSYAACRWPAWSSWPSPASSRSRSSKVS